MTDNEIAERLMRLADWLRVVLPDGNLHRDTCLTAADRLSSYDESS